MDNVLKKSIENFMDKQFDKATKEICDCMLTYSEELTEKDLYVEWVRSEIRKSLMRQLKSLQENYTDELISN